MNNASSNNDEIKLPFCMIYEPTLILSIDITKDININSLDKIRHNFIENYYKMGHNKTHPNILFDFHKNLIDKGHFEAYNHWILMKGDEDMYRNWRDLNAEKWNAFVKWFMKNGLVINDSIKFHSGQY